METGSLNKALWYFNGKIKDIGNDYHWQTIIKNPEFFVISFNDINKKFGNQQWVDLEQTNTRLYIDLMKFIENLGAIRIRYYLECNIY